MRYLFKILYPSLSLGLSGPAYSESSSAEAPSALLNSERIEESFGNYAIEVLNQNTDFRLSNLYSKEDDVQITRTLALVDFLDPVPEQLMPLHQQVMDGESLGVTFKNAGWNISKENLVFEQIDTTSFGQAAKSLMHIEGEQSLALHVYLLKLSKDEQNQSFDYAMIAELHHPDYLNLDQLNQIYGDSFKLPKSKESKAEAIAAALKKLTESELQ